MSGDSGEIYLGQVDTIEPQISGDFETIMKWADETRRMHIEANAETPKDAQQARDFGAEGIGLVRTEHMFFDPKRIVSIRKMILAVLMKKRKMLLLNYYHIKLPISKNYSELWTDIQLLSDY